MNLYRLDYTDAAMGGDYLARCYAIARAAAGRVAASEGRAVRITRIDSSGRLRPVLIAHPNGTFTRP